MDNIDKQNKMLSTYITQMDEVYLRLVSINGILHKTNSTYFPATNIEFIALQFRSVLELIALGNLVMNKNKYNKMYNRFAKDWNAKLILKDIKRINPDFYPKPITEKIVSDFPNKKSNFVEKTAGFLAYTDFLKLYDLLGGYLHARNPFDKPKDYKKLEQDAPMYIDKIYDLLESHIIKIYNGHFFLIHMNKSSKESAQGFIFKAM